MVDNIAPTHNRHDTSMLDTFNDNAETDKITAETIDIIFFKKIITFLVNLFSR